jgi:hypothetical protein
MIDLTIPVANTCDCGDEQIEEFEFGLLSRDGGILMADGVVERFVEEGWRDVSDEEGWRFICPKCARRIDEAAGKGRA